MDDCRLELIEVAEGRHYLADDRTRLLIWDEFEQGECISGRGEGFAAWHTLSDRAPRLRWKSRSWPVRYSRTVQNASASSSGATRGGEGIGVV